MKTIRKTLPEQRLSIWTAIVLMLFSGCMEKKVALSESENYCLSESMKLRTVIETAEMRKVRGSLSLTGNVEYNPDRVINFVSLVGGIITNVNFSLGDKVNKGQVLAEIRSAELSSLEAERKRIESQLKVAERQLVSVRSMHEDGIASQRDLIEAESNVDVLKAELEKIQADLSLFSASAERGVFQIKAPAAGIIVKKKVTSGMQISSGSEPLFTISDLSEVWVAVNIYAGNIVNVKEQMDVNIKTLAYPGEVFPGKITRISEVFDSEERVLKARVVMPNADMRLKPGMPVDVLVKKDTSGLAPSVPSRALIFSDNRNYLVVYKDDCTIESREVEILSLNNGTAFIKTGIDAGEKVVCQNQLLIYEHIKNK